MPQWRMVFGPCGGVRADLGCELGDRPCPFATAPPVRWTGAPMRPGTADGAARAHRPDHPARTTPVGARGRGDPRAGVRQGAGRGAPEPAGLPADAVRGPGARAGGRPVDDAGVPGPQPDRAGAGAGRAGRARRRRGAVRDRGRAGRACGRTSTQVFDLDGTRLAALAAALGVPVAVPETPAAPPVGLRPARVAEKQRAGASWRAQPRGQPGAGGRLRGRGPGGRSDDAVGRGRRGLHRRALGPGAAALPGTGPRRGEGRRGAGRARPGRRRNRGGGRRGLGRCWPSTGVAGVNLSGLASGGCNGRGRVKAEIAARIRGRR